MSRAITLHIGATKTGTTSIQQVLSESSDQLNTIGVIYPAKGRGKNGDHAHHNLAYELNKNYQDRGRFIAAQGTWTDALAEIDGGTRGIISSEAFFYFSPAAVASLAERLAGYEVTICLYLRRQDQWLSSRYNQHARFGRKFNLDNLIENSFHLRYDEMLVPWIEYFGLNNMRVRLYDAITAPGGTLHDFLQFAAPSLPIPAAKDAWRHGKAGLKQMAAMKVMAAAFSAETPPGSKMPKKYIGKVSRLFRSRSDEIFNFSMIKYEKAVELMNRLSDSNQRLYAMLRQMAVDDEFPPPVPAHFDNYFDLDQAESLLTDKDRAWLSKITRRAVNAVSAGVPSDAEEAPA